MVLFCCLEQPSVALERKLFLLRHRAFSMLGFTYFSIALKVWSARGVFFVCGHTQRCLIKLFDKAWVKYAKHTCERRDISTERLRHFLTSAKHSSNKLHTDGAERVEARR